MSRTEGGADVSQGRVRAKDVGPRAPHRSAPDRSSPTGAGVGATTSRPTVDEQVTEPSPRNRPGPDQPLRARWDPTDDAGRNRPREPKPGRKMQSALGRFVSTYGWRAYAIPVLIVLTVVLLVFTLRHGLSSKAADAEATPAGSRNVNVAQETKPIGAPTVEIREAALPAGTLPDGGPFTVAGRKTFHVVPGAGRQVGTGGQVYTYTVEVEDGLNAQDFGGDRSFGKMVDATLANPRSWIGDNKVSFRRIDRGEPDLRISLSSTGTTRELCGYQIKLESSCFYPPDKRVTLNEARWVRGALSYEGDDLLYRQYLVNHETGHGLGYENHEPCKENGALAPVMMQQSFGVANREIMALDPEMRADPNLVCKPNPWPFPAR